MMSSSILVSTLAIAFLATTVVGQDLHGVYQTQIQKEFLASNVYLTFAHRLAERGVYQGFAHFFFESAEEEREHGKKLLDFYNVRNREVSLYNVNIDDSLAGMTDVVQMIRKANELENDVLNNMLLLQRSATDAKDYATAHFIETQMLVEQTTAVKYMHDFVKRIERERDHPTVLLQMMDQELRKKQVKKA